MKLLKGNEAIAIGAIDAGCDGYFGYPITPQSEILETLTAMKPWETTGMVVLQAESEVASINMLYGGAATGKKVMTSSSSPGISLMAEGMSYLAGAELPSLIINISRGGPGLGTIQPAQSDYFQAVKAAGHGDFRLIVLAPASVQEMYDFVSKGFDLAFKYRNPVMILADGIIGQMMEKVQLRDGVKRLSEQQVEEKSGSWAAKGTEGKRRRNIITSVELDSYKQEAFNHHLQKKYRAVEQSEVMSEEYMCDDAEYLLVAYGSSARIAKKSVEIARESGIKVGLLRLITLFPFPKNEVGRLSKQVKGILAVEMSAGQMVDDVRLNSQSDVRIEHYGRYGGVIHSPEEVLNALKSKLINE